MGVHGSLKEANAHMDLCVNSVAGGKLCWDVVVTHAGHVTEEDRTHRRAMISLEGGGSTVITIQGWDIKRAKRTAKPVVAVELDACLEGTIDRRVAGGDPVPGDIDMPGPATPCTLT